MNEAKSLLIFVTCLVPSICFSQIVINEVDVSNRLVELKNQGTTNIDITGYRLCNYPYYPTISEALVESGSLIMAPGAITLISAPNIEFNINDDELGLYLPTGSFGNSDAILDYLEWGLTPHFRSNVAVAAGTWTSGEFIPTPPAGQTINFDGEGDSADDYYFNTPTLGSENNPSTACTPMNFTSAPTGLISDQSTAGGTRTTLKWDHYSDASDGCLLQGALTDGVTNISPFVQVLVEGALIYGDINGQDKSPNLGASSAYQIFNALTYPTGETGNLIPGAEYMWQVSCACIIDNSIPLPLRIFPNNLNLSPWSTFDFFTNLGAAGVEGSSIDSELKKIEDGTIELYPNPASDLLNILTSFELERGIELVLTNATGEIVYAERQDVPKNNLLNLDVSSLEAGFYLVTLNSVDSSFSKLFMKQ